VASHDRAFLDATVTRVWELRERRLTAFRGDYSAYHRQREERDARAAKDAESHVESIARERELVQRYRSHRKFSKMHEHEARLERLLEERVEAPKSGRKLRLPGARSRAAGRPGPARSSSGSRTSSSATCRGAGRPTPTGGRRRRRGPWPGFRSSPRSGESASGSWARTAPGRRRSSGRSPATCHRSTAG
jgi:hypothetical protein